MFLGSGFILQEESSSFSGATFSFSATFSGFKEKEKLKSVWDVLDLHREVIPF
jgi:hypothetical protein